MGEFKIELHTKATDSLTGFTGTVTARCEYITGCVQYQVQPMAKDGEFKEPHWFDEDRLTAADKPKSKRGGPQAFAAPTK